MQMKHKLDAILFLMVSFYVFEIQNYTHIWMHVLHTKVLQKLPKKCWILAFFPTFIVRNALTEMIDEDEGPVLKKKIFFLRNPNVNSSSKNFLEKSNLPKYYCFCPIWGYLPAAKFFIFLHSLFYRPIQRPQGHLELREKKTGDLCVYVSLVFQLYEFH